MPIVLTPRSAPGTNLQLPAPLRLDSGSAVIGRAARVDLAIAHPLVSSRHCTITGSGASWQLQDSSTNGTTINGRRVTGSQALADGDVIGLGDVEIGVRIEGAAATGAGINLQDWRRMGEPQGQTVPPQPQATRLPPTTDAVAQLLHAAGIDRNSLRAGDQEILAAAGAMLRASVEGLAAMLQARRKAREELRVAPDPASDNPLKQAPPEAALTRLLAAPPAAARQMVTDALGELDRHQQATLGAMQAAFRAALDQFAPESIKLRARDDAAAWKAYEKAFGANDGFVEVFAQELAKAYEQLS
ncbi:type VI secretion system-associated FHA domain protein [Sphingomonas sp. dw_22]|uniref:type VI secretion system-associated FHA domain protein n=1 Tax=Sphingomonas sp. dw_22 TaxID=2721175 RepID=UPI001BD52D78|nr:type VI secretion system-associated FHA domain protein [Sphingomonas sp. dw_22]